MIKGEILYGRKNSDAIHPIVYLQDHDGSLFIGAMLTSAANYPDNILMKVEHFKVNDDKGLKYELYFNNTHIVKAKLLKRNEWQPFRKVGELTAEGIKFVETNINTESEKLWEDYINGN
jgi:hypothetical protein